MLSRRRGCRAGECRSGLLSTAGNLVFGGTPQGYFFALNATTGQELWRLAIGDRVAAAPITYLVDGKQQVTIAAGNALFTFELSAETEQICLQWDRSARSCFKFASAV